MNLRDLQYLIALADYRHFGKAAEACFVSQPALSMQIQKLENYLGVQLLERSKKTVLLTEIGVTIANKARNIMHHIDELKEIANHARDPFSGDLKIGIIPTLAPYLLPHIMHQLSNALPKLNLYLIEGQTNNILDQLKLAKIDVAILATSEATTHFSTTSLFEEEFYLAVPKNHVFAKRKKMKSKDLAEQTLLLLEDGHCLRDQALAFCDRLKIKTTTNFQATSLETLRYMVTNGIGITLVPKLAIKHNDGIVYIPFENPRPSRVISLLRRHSSLKEKLITQIVKHIQHIMQKHKVVKILK